MVVGFKQKKEGNRTGKGLKVCPLAWQGWRGEAEVGTRDASLLGKNSLCISKGVSGIGGGVPCEGGLQDTGSRRSRAIAS